MEVTENAVLSALRQVQEPELFKDIISLNMVKNVKTFDGMVSLDLETANPAVRDRLKADVTRALMALPGVKEVDINVRVPLGGAAPQQQQHAAHAPARGQAGVPPAPKPLPGVTNIVAVGAGKGGVGKSTVAINLAVGLAKQGFKVGLLDADIYGPSVPTMSGIGQRLPEIKVDRIIPFDVTSPDGKASIKVMSIGFIVEREKALIWRGPMAHGAIKQFLEQVDWGTLDYLVVDLPPGTGDVALTLAQTVPLTGAVIVATPQEVALADARRAVRMFQQLGVEILGVVENMSYFVCEHGTAYDIFGRGGAQMMAQQMGLGFLGEVPIDTRVRVNSDLGKPFENFEQNVTVAPHLSALVKNLVDQVAIRHATKPAAGVNFSIS